MSFPDGWVELDAAGVKEILASPEIVGLITGAANKAADVARKTEVACCKRGKSKGSGHVCSHPEDVGAYKNSITVEVRPTGDKTHLAAYVVAPFGARIEANDGVLHRALRVAKI